MATSQTQIFLDISFSGNQIRGESTIADFEGLIEIDSFRFGISAQQAPGQGRGQIATRVTYRELTLSKVYDRSSPSLASQAAKRIEFDHAKLIVNQHRSNQDSAHQLPALVVTLRQGAVKSIDLSSSPGQSASALSESITLTFKKLTMEFYPPTQGSTGRASTPLTFTGQVAAEGGQV